MRGKWNHVSPPTHQIEPDDNTTKYVMAQVCNWDFGDSTEGWNALVIHPEAAMEIAAWWQAPGNAFSVFASTGTLGDGQDLTAEIQQAMRDNDNRTLGWLTGEDRARHGMALRALLAYVEACNLNGSVV